MFDNHPIRIVPHSYTELYSPTLCNYIKKTTLLRLSLFGDILICPYKYPGFVSHIIIDQIIIFMSCDAVQQIP